MQVNFHAVAHRQPATSHPKKPHIYQHTPSTINTPLDPLVSIFNRETQLLPETVVAIMIRRVASCVSAKGNNACFVRRMLAISSKKNDQMWTAAPSSLHRRQLSSLGGSNPMFPERAVPEAATAADKHKISDEADFLTRHGGKVALVALSVAIALFYTYYESGQSKNRVEDALNNEATIEPYEINEIRFLNTLTAQLYDTLTESCLLQFPSGMTTYPEFVAFVNSFMSRYNAEMLKTRVKQAPSSSQQVSTEAFIPSAQFAGRKEGYYFQAGQSGVGYYRDPLEQRKVQRQEAESTAPVVLRGGHLFDRLVASYLVKQHQTATSSTSGNSTSLMDSSGDLPTEEPSLASTHVSVAYLLVALNMAQRTAAPQRADSLFALAQGVDRTRSGDDDDGRQGDDDGRQGNDDDRQGSDRSVSWAAAEEIVRHLGDSWQLPAERRVTETGVKYPIKTYRRKTATDMMRAYVTQRSKDHLAKEGKGDQSPPPPDPATVRISKADFQELLLGGQVCAWAECYREK